MRDENSQVVHYACEAKIAACVNLFCRKYFTEVDAPNHPNCFLLAFCLKEHVVNLFWFFFSFCHTFFCLDTFNIKFWAWF